MERSNRTIESVKTKTNNYVYAADEVSIVDVKIEGIDKTLSFIQCYRDSTIQEVVNRFDIDICQIIYHIHEQGFELDESVAESIADGYGNVRFEPIEENDGPFDPGYEIDFDSFNAGRKAMTEERVSKYSQRGFQLYWVEDEADY